MTPNQPSLKYSQILEGAMAEFLAHGYSGTSLDRIATRAGVSKATVHSYFQYKENLFKGLVSHLAQQKIFKLFGDQPKLEGKPDRVLKDLASNFLALTCNDPQILQFIRLVIGESHRFPDVAQLFKQSLYALILPLLTDYFRQQCDPHIPDPEATSHVFLGGLMSFILVQEILRGKDIYDISPDRFVDALISGLIKSEHT